MSETIGVLSDAHGNGHAFARGLDVLRSRGATRFVFLGDSVGYIPSVDVVTRLMDLGDKVQCVIGNHEDMLLSGQAARDDVYKHAATISEMTPTQRAFIESWERSITKTVGGRRLLFVHGSPGDPTSGYVYPDTDLSSFRADADYVFMGHTHHPFIRSEKKTTFVNVGSCGLPRDDGRFGCAAIIDASNDDATVLRFDITAATGEILDGRHDVHPSVCELFARRRDSVFGEVV